MTITLAIDRYDRLMPFHDSTVELSSGLDLKVLQVGQEGQGVALERATSRWAI